MPKMLYWDTSHYLCFWKWVIILNTLHCLLAVYEDFAEFPRRNKKFVFPHDQHRATDMDLTVMVPSRRNRVLFSRVYSFVQYSCIQCDSVPSSMLTKNILIDLVFCGKPVWDKCHNRHVLAEDWKKITT